MLKSSGGAMSIEVPRDRNSSFEPILVGKSRLKHIDDQVLSLYSRGMTVRDIQAHVLELYGTAISGDLISTITDSVAAELTEWRNRPLDKLYPIIFIDGFVVKGRI